MNHSLRTSIKHFGCDCLLLTHFSAFHSFTSLSSPQTTDRFLQRQQQQQQQDPYALMKEDPIQICSNIWVKSFSTPKSKHFANLTGFLSKFDIWVLSYQRSVAHFTGSFPSSNAIASQVLHDLRSLHNAVVKGQFRWNMKTQLYIGSPTDKPMSNRNAEKWQMQQCRKMANAIEWEMSLSD